MALLFYVSSPFNSATALDQLDFAVGDGSTQSFLMANKTGTRVGSTVQAGSTEYFRATGGVVISGNFVTLSSPPANGVNIVFPGVTSLVLAAFDNDTPPVNNPREAIQPFYLINMDDISLKQHTLVPEATGINIFFVNNILNVGPDLTWLRLACADASGNMLTALASGQTLSLPDIKVYSTIASGGIAANSNYIPVASATGFYGGMYCLLNPGQTNSEEVHVVATNNTLNVLYIDSGLQYDHSYNENIYHNGFKCYAICDVPSGATGNTAVNYYNIGIERQCITTQRP